MVTAQSPYKKPVYTLEDISEMERLVRTVALFSFAFFLPAVKGCSLLCAQDKQEVCAHNPQYGYRNFSDKCAIEQANHCGGQDWTLIHPKPCTPNEKVGCPKHCQPVCGYSPTKGYKSFLSKCILEIEIYISGSIPIQIMNVTDYRFAHEGACTALEVPPSVCPGICTLIFAPVCGYSPLSGYHTFPSRCSLGVENRCHFGTYSLRHTGKCTEEELKSNCKHLSFCTKEYNPVCGFSVDRGFKTFSTLCTFYSENGCPVNKYEPEYKLVHSGACSTQEIASFCKPGFCSENGQPVCASSLPFYRTFRSKCLYFVENSCKYGDYKIEHSGECTNSEREQSCNVKCFESFGNSSNPVCGYSYSRGYQTFKSTCFINRENGCYGSDYNVIRLGACKTGELESICGKDYCRQQKGRKVCGLSHSKGYKTFDNECYLYSENTCKYGDYKLAHFNECSQKETDTLCNDMQFCNVPGSPICAYSSNTKSYFSFENECLLNRENICKGGDFAIKHEGKCTNYETGGRCPLICTEQINFICGVSQKLGYKTFSNRCELDAENGCNGGDYTLFHRGECSKEELEKNCQKVCTYEYKPVCAKSPTKGYYSFNNKCVFFKHVSCYGSDFKFVHGGKCSDNEDSISSGPPTCQPGGHQCSDDKQPVCAYSKSNNAFQTFPSKCVFEADNKCKHSNDFIFAHSGACSRDEQVNNCQRSCSGEVAPVCGVSPSQGYKTFKNPCKLLYGISCTRSDFTFAHDGYCTSNEGCTGGCIEILAPVCGFSISKKVFKTFENKCVWEKENRCNFGDYIFAHDGSCTEGEEGNDCLRTCEAKHAPVCGYSPTKGYKTFQNKCDFIRQLSCSDCDYVFSNEGKCEYPEGPLKNCPAICTFLYQPVCAHSAKLKGYKTFSNQCFLTGYNRCNYGDYVVLHEGQCKKGEPEQKCYRKCPVTYKPVCGYHVIDGFRTFPNFCELDTANKCDGADYSLAHGGKCTRDELKGSCNHNCPMIYNATCGFSPIKGFKTFASECFMDRENTCSFSDYTVKHDGKCTSQETGNKCNHHCVRIFTPICVFNPATQKHKSLENFCRMDLENSCNNKDYKFKHQGECFPWELCQNCKH